MIFLKNETFRYLIAGTVTVCVNILIYSICSVVIPHLIANMIAFFLATLFAFWSNSVFVFRTACRLKNLIEFLTMRLLSLAVDSAGMMFLLWLKWDDIVSKVIVNFVVIIINYIFSKIVIFRRN